MDQLELLKEALFCLVDEVKVTERPSEATLDLLYRCRDISKDVDDFLIE